MPPAENAFLLLATNYGMFIRTLPRRQPWYCSLTIYPHRFRLEPVRAGTVCRTFRWLAAARRPATARQNVHQLHETRRVLRAQVRAALTAFLRIPTPHGAKLKGFAPDEWDPRHRCKTMYVAGQRLSASLTKRRRAKPSQPRISRGFAPQHVEPSRNTPFFAAHCARVSRPRTPCDRRSPRLAPRSSPLAPRSSPLAPTYPQTPRRTPARSVRSRAS